MISSLRKAVLGETAEGHKGTVRQVACSADGKLAVSASGDHTCIVWDVEAGRFSRKCSLGSVPSDLTGGGQVHSNLASGAQRDRCR